MVPGEILNMDKMDGVRPPGDSVLKETMLPIHGHFYQQFEWYLYAIKADNEPDMRKISLFLTVAGPEAFTYGTGESPKTYADVMNTFIYNCMPKKNLVCERFLFNTCNQNKGQTIDNFVTELRRKAQCSEYDEIKDALIIDRIVVGTKLQEKMLHGSKRHSLQAVELSQRTQAAVQIVSNLPAPSNGGPIYRFLGMRARWMAGAVAHKSG